MILENILSLKIGDSINRKPLRNKESEGRKPRLSSNFIAISELSKIEVDKLNKIYKLCFSVKSDSLRKIEK